ncbi:hypothetical protein BDE36_1429 [Arcticibacter tournemirensis]|uniref:Flippase-like domain-containing protein n=1 Tax=Arcticibacter tournemirensis TaxID=699437 RepID=A0A5M9H7J2_9SPHI|nr:lysylphosphatidylglycerol synthase transmembrane domain-containing protein [Arcticibacter tournemirensis]KAA8482912.1 flippase-like domain-containing protein [Arcticibacter tournemirensis]TQM49704.1 hypothetical protein BDE36_1429 [Arcticibacter tournemirensis]
MENDQEKDIKQVFQRKLIIKGCLWLTLLTTASIAAVFFYNNTGSMLNAIKHIKPKFILTCICMVFVDLMLGSWRNHIFVRKLYPRLSHWVSFRANVANMFMGAITPFHSGAGPAQLYVYNRYGVKVLDGFIISLINMGATLLFMPVAGFIAILIMNDQLETGLVPALLKYGFTVFFIFLLTFVLAFLKPVWVGRGIQLMAFTLGKVFVKKNEALNSWADKSFANIAKYQAICSKLLNDHPFLFPMSLIITGALYFNKYCMQYIILLGLGIHTSFAQVVAVQILIQFMIYFAPSPGGSGFAEASIAILFSSIVPADVISVFTLLQRSFLLFFPALVGAYVVLSLLKKQTFNDQ